MGWLKKTAKKLKKHVEKTMSWDPATNMVLGIDAKKEAQALAEQQAQFAVDEANKQASATAEASRAAFLSLAAEQQRAKQGMDAAKAQTKWAVSAPDVELGASAKEQQATVKRKNQFRVERRV